MSSSIFRKEALQHQLERWNGQVMLNPKWSRPLILAFSLIFTLGIVLFITFGEYTRRTTISGEVISSPKTIDVNAVKQGYITDIRVKPGDMVEKGDVLFFLDVSISTEFGRVSDNTLSALNDQRYEIDDIITNLEKNKQQTISLIDKQLQQYNDSLKELSRSLETVKKGVSENDAVLKQYRQYLDQGIITKDQLASQRYQFYQQQSVYQSIYNQQIQTQLQISQLNNERKMKLAEFDNQVSEYNAKKSSLRSSIAEAEATGKIAIIAPAEGRIDNISVTSGQIVNTGDSLVQITPGNEKNLRLVLWLPNTSIPYVKVGDSVNIRYDAFPYQKFGQFPGTILSISGVPATQNELKNYTSAPVPIQGKSEPYYKALVSLPDPKQHKNIKVVVGMTAQSTVFLEDRPLYQWILTPYYDVQKSLSGAVK